ncbi:MAG TPA: hypothetical protein P5205_08300 [Candidatus Paceibacterota bacterium]|nr:hypothetical protein [Verrucomicrobiota bacterium]HSA10360.1 hypothetical protein [Candidatus Paceibacterota bacterium]
MQNEPLKRMTRAEFAAEYQISVKTVDRLIKKGQVQWFRLGRKVFVLPVDEKNLPQRRAG